LHGEALPGYGPRKTLLHATGCTQQSPALAHHDESDPAAHVVELPRVASKTS
jgi:hypothetical protein